MIEVCVVRNGSDQKWIEGQVKEYTYNRHGIHLQASALSAQHRRSYIAVLMAT